MPINEPTEDSIRNAGAIPSLNQVCGVSAETAVAMKLTGQLSTIDVVDVVIAVTGGSGGATAGVLTADIKDTTALAAALAKTGVFLILAHDTQYAGSRDLNATTTFGTATKGSILGSGTGWAVVKADASGQVAIVPSNSADETIWFSCASVNGGVDAVANGVVVRGCIAVSATWAA